MQHRHFRCHMVSSSGVSELGMEQCAGSGVFGDDAAASVLAGGF